MITAGSYRLDRVSGGAHLITAPMADRSSASLVLMFGVGSRYEDDRLGGASHFVEHLLFKGTERRPTAKDIAEAIEGVGGVMNASTDKELTVFWARVPAGRLELAVDVLFDMTTGSKLAPDDVDRERMVILEELKMYQDQPQDYVHSLFEEVMWPGHPMGRDIGGTLESVAALSREDLAAHVSRHYRPDRLVVGVSGGFETEPARALIEGRLADSAAASEDCDYLPLTATRAQPTVLVSEKKTEQAHICLGVPGLSYLDPDRYVIDLITTILGEGMSSRLFLEIREKRGLAYDVHAYTSKHSDGGYLGVYLGVDPKKAEEAIAAVLGEWHRLVGTPVSPAELEKVKEYTKGRLLLALESTNAVANWLCQQQLLMGEVRTVDQVVEAVDKVTAVQIQELSARLFNSAVQMAVIGPFKSDAPFRSLIE